MKKKIISILTVICIFAALPCTAFASEGTTFTSEGITLSNEDSYITYLDDGSYYTVTITESVARSVKAGSKSVTYSSSTGEDLWKVAVNGSFSYNGTSVTCTSASYTVTIYDSAWYKDSGSAYASGNQAIADVTMKKKLLGVVTSTRNVHLVLSCDKNGNLS